MKFIVLVICLMSFLTGCGVEWFPEDAPSGTVSIATTTLANAPTDIAYSQTLTASGGTGTYSWVLASGSLPPGLTLSTAGTISGTPTAVSSTAAGTNVYSFTLKATDTATTPATTTRDLSIFTPTTGRMHDSTGKVYAENLTFVINGTDIEWTLLVNNADVADRTIQVVIANYDNLGIESQNSAFTMTPLLLAPGVSTTATNTKFSAATAVNNWRIKSVSII